MFRIVFFVTLVPILKAVEGKALLLAKNFLTLVARFVLFNQSKHGGAVLFTCCFVHPENFATKLPRAEITRKMYQAEGILIS